jgi:hypothetical protein
MRCSFFICSVLGSFVLILGCSNTTQLKPDSRAPISISWEFKSIEKDGEAFTEAVMIINGKRSNRHLLGLFYGMVIGILSPEKKRKEMEGGTLSGFITDKQGRGVEVLVRYNEYLNTLIVVTRQLIPETAPGPYKTFKVIPFKKPDMPATGF